MCVCDEPSARHFQNHDCALSNLALLKEDAPLGIHAAGEQAGSHVANVLAQQERSLRDRERVQVHDAVHHVIVRVLQLHPLPKGTKIVAQMSRAGGLNARENSPQGGHGRAQVELVGIRRALRSPAHCAPPEIKGGV